MVRRLLRLGLGRKGLASRGGVGLGEASTLIGGAAVQSSANEARALRPERPCVHHRSPNASFPSPQTNVGASVMPDTRTRSLT